MRGSPPAKLAGLLAAVAALAVVTSGCIAQDRPHEATFFVVADAGEAQVLAVGATASLTWPENRTVLACVVFSRARLTGLKLAILSAF